MTKTKKEKVVLAMSGGVDSSVAAAILLEQGYEVIGVTMQIWPSAENEEREGGCCSLSAVHDARRVADRLGIPFYVMNFKDLFEEKVINYFTQEYLEGRTPNPCIACNRHVKFGSFLHKAIALEADYIATGHYAKIEYNPNNNRYLLKRAVDQDKDQTYALYGFTQDQLAKTLLPLGEFTKPQIRQKAAELGLAVANKPDSQEICFVTDDNYKNFLEERVGKEIKPGPFLNTKGEVIGKHSGIAYYTIGQRKGLGLALGYPAYVVAIDKTKNAVVIGTSEEVFSDSLLAVDNNFISIEKLTEPMEVQAKIRYAAPPAPAVIEPYDTDKVLVKFKNEQRAITPGQAVVYYQGDVIVGGGTII